jgi:RHS repeat-associated protein
VLGAAGECVGDGVRWVGDPVDVVTGALVEGPVEFSVAGRLPIVWRRHYSTARAGVDGPLGFGHRHDFERSLRAGVDGWLLRQGDGEELLFPYDAEELPQSGWRLRSIERGHELRSPGGEVCVFSRSVRSRQEDGAASEPERLVEISRAGEALTLSYDAAGRLAELADRGRERVVAVEWSGERIAALVLKAHPLRGDGRSLVLMRYEYDARGDLVASTDRYGHKRIYRYDDAHRLVFRTDRNGYGFEYAYDAAGRCVFAQGVDGVEAVRLRYMPEALATEVTLADGGAWLHRYDDVGSIVEIIDPYGGIRRFEYDAEGHLVAETDAGGSRRRALHDAAGEVTGWVNEAGGVRPAEDPTGPPAHRVPQTAAELELGDLAGEILGGAPLASAGLEPLLHAGASIFSELFAARDPRGEARCRRDELGLLVAEEREGAAPRRWAYTPNGWVRSYIDHEGGRYDFEYMSWNHRVGARDPLGRELRYEYTPRHEIAAVVDPAGNRHEYRYDLRNLLTAVHHSGALVETYEHDVAGNLVCKRDARGEVLVRYEYGAENLKKRRVLADGEEHRYEYAPNGRFLKVEYPGHVLDFGYAANGRRCRDLRDGQGVEHVFGASGELRETRALGRFVTRYRRLDEKTVEVEDPLGNKHAIVLEQDGVVVRRMASGAREVVQYDSLGRCLGRHLDGVEAAAPVWRRRFEYSPEGDLRAVDDSELGRTEYRYDAAHQLAEVDAADGVGSGAYKYDAAGNLVEAPHLRGVEIAAGNKLVRANGGELSYDHRNNLARWQRVEGDEAGLRARELRFHRDSLDRLRRIEGLEKEWTAEYDPLGRRTRKTYGERWTEFFWDTDRLAAELRDDGRLRVYVYADDFSLTPWLAIDYDGVDAEPDSGKLYYLVCDQRGAPVAALDAAGRRVWSARIEPYGLARVEVEGEGDFELGLRLAGQYWDEESGLCYNRFRYYCPEIGRYIEEDPAGTGGGVNLYGYTDCPLVRWDARGTDCAKSDSSDCETQDQGAKKSPTKKPPWKERSKGTQGRKQVEQMLREGVLRIDGDKKYRAAVLHDLYKIANTTAGRDTLDVIRQAGKPVTIQNWNPNAPGNSCLPGGKSAFPPPEGDGKGSSSTVYYDPREQGRSEGSPSDAGLNHELGHAASNSTGTNERHLGSPEPGYPNSEEHKVTTKVDNPYRKERGYPEREDYGDLP